MGEKNNVAFFRVTFGYWLISILSSVDSLCNLLIFYLTCLQPQGAFKS
nr:MAG TPA: hypothetical protein [Caudoviricetes sp.]